MEQQLKERLVGAAVLVAAAIILVPEMLSGPEEQKPVSNAETPSGLVKTYSIDLQQPAGAVASTPEEPAPQAAVEETPAAFASAEEETAGANAESTAGEQAETPVAAASPPEAAKPNNEIAPAQVIEKPSAVASVAEKKPPNSNGGWAIQVGSFSTQAKAQSVAAGLEKRGFNTFVRTATVNGRVWHRVRIGPVSERGAAESMLAKIKVSEPGASVVPQ